VAMKSQQTDLDNMQSNFYKRYRWGTDVSFCKRPNYEIIKQHCPQLISPLHNHQHVYHTNT